MAKHHLKSATTTGRLQFKHRACALMQTTPNHYSHRSYLQSKLHSQFHWAQCRERNIKYSLWKPKPQVLARLHHICTEL